MPPRNVPCREEVRVKLYIYSFLTSTLDGSGDQSHDPAAPPWIKPPGRTRRVWRRENFSPPSEFESPDNLARSEALY